jgi:membrane-associated phospholipid phosphatase
MRRLLTLAAALAVAVHPLCAQAPAPAPQQADSATSSEHLFTRRDALVAGAFLVGAAALAPLDRTLDDELQDPAYQDRLLLSRSATGFRRLGYPGAPILAVAAYAGGRVLHRPGLADAGLHTTEAVVFANVVTDVTKNLVGRARPFVSPDDPYDVNFGKGFSSGDYRSFPSGHTSTAFSAASAATVELGRWAPRYRVPGGIVLYGAATLVGVSRMYNQKHWATDVLTGAAIGTFSGWKIVDFNHNNPGNRLDRMLLSATPVPTADGGLALVWSFRQ